MCNRCELLEFQLQNATMQNAKSLKSGWCCAKIQIQTSRHDFGHSAPIDASFEFSVYRCSSARDLRSFVIDTKKCSDCCKHLALLLLLYFRITNRNLAVLTVLEWVICCFCYRIIQYCALCVPTTDFMHFVAIWISEYKHSRIYIGLSVLLMLHSQKRSFAFWLFEQHHYTVLSSCCR